jgi:parallel beta-helix repeat protein
MKSRIVIVSPVFLICLLFLQRPLLAAQFFVSTSGSDTADGSCTHPFKSIEDALPRVKPGDEIVITAGEYPSAFDITGVNGTKDNPVVIRAEKNKRVLISPQAQRTVGIKVSDCSYVTIRGLEIKGITETMAIVLDTCHYCKIVGNVVHDCKKIGIYLGASNDNHVLGNICYHNDGGIYIGRRSTRNLVEANVCAFGNASSENADGIASSNCRRNTYRFNLLVGNNDDGLDMWTSKQNTIEYNFACSNGDRKEGDGNGFKLGGNWKNRRPDSTWDGGENIVRHNLSCWNLSTGFTNNGSSHNEYEHNVSFGNLNTSAYASVPHCNPREADGIRAEIRKRFSQLIDDGIIQQEVHPLPLDVGLIRELKVWP